MGCGCISHSLVSDVLTIDGYLRSSSFVHLFCGIWHQELNFEDPVHLNVVEGASKVDPLKIDQVGLGKLSRRGAARAGVLMHPAAALAPV